MPVSEYDANGALVTPLIGRLMIGEAMRRHMHGARFVMTHAQRTAIANCAITFFREELKNPEEFDKATADRDLTFCGLPVDVDDTLPKDVIELRDLTGGVLAKVKNLAAPKED